MKTYKLIQKLVVLFFTLWSLSSCGASSGKLEGKVFWSISGTEQPLANATVELHDTASEPAVITKSVTNEEGLYSFSELKPSTYMLMLLTFESQNTNSPCRSGSPQGMLGGWLDTSQAVESSIRMLSAGGRTVDISGLKETVAQAQQKNVPWVGFLTIGTEVTIEAGETEKQDVSLEC